MVISDGVRSLDRDLHDIFGNRMQSLVAYASAEPSTRSSTLAVVVSITPEDLRACASRVAAWREAGVATPLILETQEFGRSLDAFPFEFGAILADHALVSGANPFEGLRVDPADARRACEIQARSHLLHLREGYIETEGRSDRLADLITRSSGPLAALVRNVTRLNGGRAVEGVLARVVEIGEGPLASDEARRLFPDYLTAVEQLTNEIDRWSRA
jgi:hypothetical protein